MFLRTPTLRSGGLKLSYTHIRQRRHYIKKISFLWKLIFLLLKSSPNYAHTYKPDSNRHTQTFQRLPPRILNLTSF